MCIILNKYLFSKSELARMIKMSPKKLNEELKFYNIAPPGIGKKDKRLRLRQVQYFFDKIEISYKVDFDSDIFY